MNSTTDSSCKQAPGRHARLLQLLFVLATVGACSTERVQPRPVAWPAPTAGTTGCGDVFGRYVDPSDGSVGLNIAAGEFDLYRDRLESASYVFGLHIQDSRFHNIKPGRSTFGLSRSTEGAIGVDFQIDDQTVAVNKISKARWICASNGLTMTVQSSDRAAIDKVPGHAVTRHEVLMYRVGESLYVQSTEDATAFVFGVFPSRTHEVYWNHYQALP